MRFMFAYCAHMISSQEIVAKRLGFLLLLKMSLLIILESRLYAKNIHLIFFDWETEQLHSTTPSPEDVLQASDEFMQVQSALEHCTGDQKMVIIMRYFQDLSIAETAQILDWTEAKVKTTQHRAIKFLRQQLQQVSEQEAKWQ